MIKRQWWIGLVMLLSACYLDQEPPSTPEPPPGTPIAQATATAPAPAATITPPSPTLTHTPIGIITATPSNTPFPLPTAAPTLTLAPTNTAIPTATNTPFTLPTPQPTLPPGVLPTLGAPPTFTPSGLFPTFPPGSPTVPGQPSPTPVLAYTLPPPPTFTPIPSATTAPPSAYVCPSCDFLRLRELPGTAANVLRELEPNTPLVIIGRTADNTWAQVITAEGQQGWVATSYLVLQMDLNSVGVTGEATNAPTAVAMGGGNIISGVSSHARQIFLDGLAKGNLPHVFTRVGDSITAAPQFLTPFGLGQYHLGDYGYLSGAIGFFSGPNGRGANPFVASSLAARNSWSSASILDPALADPNVCRPGETPLACEYRLVRPSVALIMIGTNDSGGMPAETFRANLQAIVQISINMGVIPVLSTIPPKHYNPATDGRVAEFNAIIIATARAYDVPLWDYHAAMRAVPGEGLAPDGVHPSTAPDGLNGYLTAANLQYGYPLRNLGALAVLYTLWQQVLYDADTAIPATLPPNAATPGSGPYACPGAPVPQLTVGGQGRVTPGLPNKVRSTPGFGGAQIGSIPGEGVFSVIDGPVCAEGYNWWQVNYNGLIGWTADGDANEYWVVPE